MGGMELPGNGCSRAAQCRKQSSKPAGTLQQWKGTLAASRLVPALQALRGCCFTLSEKRRRAGEGKAAEGVRDS